MSEDTNKAELEVLKTFGDIVMFIQQQLHESYLGERQLRDLLVN